MSPSPPHPIFVSRTYGQPIKTYMCRASVTLAVGSETSTVNHRICQLVAMHFRQSFSAVTTCCQWNTLFNSTCLVQFYFKYDSAGKCCRKFQFQFPEEPVPSNQSDLWLLFVGKLKHKVNPHTLEKLRNIFHEISTISREKLQTVNMFHRYTECIWAGGQHFQHML
jgi:hypothetical protein